MEFVCTTDFDTLSTHLYQENLLSHTDMVEFESIKSTRGKKNFLYMLLLDTKGANAYQTLYDCLRKAEEHCGHKDLVRIIDRGLREMNHDDND